MVNTVCFLFVSKIFLFVFAAFRLFSERRYLGLYASAKQGCRSLLSIAGYNLQFYPNFALFSTLGWWTSTTIFFRWAKKKWRPTKKRSSPKMEPFLSEFRWRPNKKKVFTKKWALFSPNSSWDLRSDAHQSQNIGGGCRCRPYSNYWGGYSQIIVGDISPRVSAPLRPRYPKFNLTSVEVDSKVILFLIASKFLLKLFYTQMAVLPLRIGPA